MTRRSSRRLEGFTEALKEFGYQHVACGDLVVHSMDGFAVAIGVSESDGKMSPVANIYSVDGDARFFAYVLRAQALNGYVAALAKGIRERSTSFDHATISGVLFPSPDVATQRRIADFLDDRVARIDQIIAARRNQEQLLNEVTRAGIDAALQPRAADRMTRLGRFSEVRSGLTLDAGRDSSGFIPRPYLRVANVQDGYLDLSEVKEVLVSEDLASRTTLRPGDVLMTEGGDLDKLARGTVWSGELAGCLHQNHIFAVRPDASLLPDFLALYTRTSTARAYFESTGSRSTNLASTSASKVRDLPMPVRSLEQQREDVAAAEASVDAHGIAKAHFAAQVALLTEYKQSLITAAVTGHLDVTTVRRTLPQQEPTC